VYGNRLNGSIPGGFQKLESLTYLNLSSNNFKGQIPSELGHIVNLDTLDLSYNEFSGPVPPTIGDLEHLLCHVGPPISATFSRAQHQRFGGAGVGNNQWLKFRRFISLFPN